MKIAILGNYATQFLYKPLLKRLKAEFQEVEVYHAEFNTIDFELIDNQSNLYQFQPDFIVWHESTLALRDNFYQTNLADRQLFADHYMGRLQQYLQNLATHLPNAKVLFPNHALNFNDNVFGNYGNKVLGSWDFQVKKINYLLNELALQQANFYPSESCPTKVEEVITHYPMVVNAELHFTPNYLNWLSGELVKQMLAFTGKFKKCVILDLDNTLWGGIIGDDGLENIHIGSLGIGKAFTRFQKWLKELKNRGIILAVCSKNEENIAKMPFLQHPEMVLKLDDIAVFVANWESKADNIHRIQQILNIGFDSMVFLDDNPAEREMVKSHLPAVCVPDLPEDPAEYLPFLIEQNLFETASYSGNDQERTKQYQAEAMRVELSKSITNMADYLASLEMKSHIRAFEPVDVERIAQLTQRSNQFNLRTVRYTSAEIERMINNPEYFTLAVDLKDKFGDYGLISAVIVKLNGDEAFIDTWIMSCRVLKRGVEQMVMDSLKEGLKRLNIKTLRGEYLPTEKNKLVEHLLPEMGFEAHSEQLSLHLW